MNSVDCQWHLESIHTFRIESIHNLLTRWMDSILKVWIDSRSHWRSTLYIYICSRCILESQKRYDKYGTLILWLLLHILIMARSLKGTLSWYYKDWQSWHSLKLPWLPDMKFWIQKNLDAILNRLLPRWVSPWKPRIEVWVEIDCRLLITNAQPEFAMVCK